MLALLSPLIALFGGTAFRLIIGNFFDWFKQATDHKQEMDKMRLQMEIDTNEHRLNTEALTLQAQLGIKTIEAQSTAALNTLQTAGDQAALLETIRGINDTSGLAPTGKWWIDGLFNVISAWNKAIRPFMANIAIVIWLLALNKAGWVASDWDKELVGGILGMFIGERIHAKRNCD